MATKRAAKPPQFVPASGAPTRAYRSTAIQWNLISLQVDFYAGGDQQKTNRSSWVKAEDGKSYHPVGKKDYDKETDELVDSTQVVKGVAVGDKVILVSDEELNLSTEYGQSKLLKFIDRDQIFDNPNVILTNHYQVRPSMQRVGRDRRTNRQAEKLFGLLRDRLKANNKVAILNLVMQDGGAPKMGVLDHHGICRLILPQELVRQQRPLSETEVSADEAKLIDQLIAKDTIKDLPEFHDKTLEELNRIVQLKLDGKSLPKAQVSKPKQENENVMDLLQKSLRK